MLLDCSEFKDVNRGTNNKESRKISKKGTKSNCDYFDKYCNIILVEIVKLSIDFFHKKIISKNDDGVVFAGVYQTNGYVATHFTFIKKVQLQ